MTTTTLNLVLLGLGKVGRALVRQVIARQDALQESGIHLRFTALADSRGLLAGAPLATAQVLDAITHKENGAGLAGQPHSRPLASLPDLFQPGTLVIDTSASQDLDLRAALQAGCRVVFANKNAMSAAWPAAHPYYRSIQVAYEATVGAGLPVIRTLRSLVDTGDRVTRIEGVMSGTLGFLCSQLEMGVPYSQAVKAAFDAGYTEPDPRDDLSGFDVARKALILARTAGWQLEMDDLQVAALYDTALADLTVAEFFEQMPVLDRAYQQRVEIARQQGKALRYLAVVTPEGGTVGLQAVEKNSALGALQGPGNYIAFTTQRYAEVPLVIAGPGAGIEVTAAGVFADILAFAAQSHS